MTVYFMSPEAKTETMFDHSWKISAIRGCCTWHELQKNFT